jgi:hypothetical protein
MRMPGGQIGETPGDGFGVSPSSSLLGGVALRGGDENRIELLGMLAPSGREPQLVVLGSGVKGTAWDAICSIDPFPCPIKKGRKPILNEEDYEVSSKF